MCNTLSVLAVRKNEAHWLWTMARAQYKKAVKIDHDGYLKRQSHQACDQVTTNVRSKIVRIVRKSQKQRTTGRRGRRR